MIRGEVYRLSRRGPVGYRETQEGRCPARVVRCGGPRKVQVVAHGEVVGGRGGSRLYREEVYKGRSEVSKEVGDGAGR